MATLVVDDAQGNCSRRTKAFCQACKKLKLKFKGLVHNDERFQDDNKIVVGELMVSNNKNVEDPFTDFVALELGITKIPHVQFYAKRTLVDTFHCHAASTSGCDFAILKQKMLALVEKHYEAPQLARSSASIQDSPKEAVARRKNGRWKTWLGKLFGNRNREATDRSQATTKAPQ